MRILLLSTFLLIASCVQQVEPIDENAEPAKISGIQILNISTDRAQIKWSLDVAGSGYVEYGFTSSYGSISPKVDANLLDHVIQLANLSDDKLYHFRIVSIDKNLNRVVSGDLTFKTLAASSPAPSPAPTPTPTLNAQAPMLSSAVRSGDNYILSFAQSGDMPAGGHDTFINNQDQNDSGSHSGLSRVITGLDKTIDQCFKVEARYTQASPEVFLQSNEICVAKEAPAPAPTPTAQAPVLVSAVRSGDNYVLSISQPNGSLLPAGGYDTFINNQDQNDNANYSGMTRSISGLDKYQEQCFKVEARYTQLNPSVFPASNQICVTALAQPTPTPNPTPNPSPTPSPIPTPPSSGGLKAFPTAYGAGADAIGGRGGIVVPVTNLNDSGPGSFREAMRMTVPRIIVFRVAGVITLNSLLYLSNANSYVTVAGQTAPAGGITITGERLYLSNVDHVIVRYIRFRGKYSLYQDNVTGAGGNDIIFDHVSSSFGGDECISFKGNAKNAISGNEGGVTLQRTLMAESKTGSILGFQGNDKTNSFDASYLYNLAYNIPHRFPNFSGEGNYEAINNVVHHWRNRLIRGNDSFKLNHINNYYYKARYSKPIEEILNKYQLSSGSPLIYTAGNLLPHQNFFTDPNADNWPLWNDFNTGKLSFEQIPRMSQASSMLPLLGAPVPILSAEEAFQSVTQDVGANARLDANGNKIADIDSLDQSYLNDVRNKIGNAYRSTSEYKIPTINPGTPYQDSDGDGMPDQWEQANGFNPSVDDSAGDKDGDGYTNIEEFLNLVDLQ